VTITIGICAFNEERNIGPLLNVLLAQELPFPTETIVVSDGSTDATDSIVQEIAKKNLGMRLVRHSNRKGKSEALNTLFRESRGEIVVTISGDMQIEVGSVRKMVDTIRGLPTVGMCWAKPIPIFPERGLVERIGHLAFRLHDRFYKKLNLAGEVRHSTGELVVFRREAFTQLPADCVNDDEYLALQATRKGFKVHYVTEITAGASLPRTMLDYVKQRRRWVYGHFQTRRILGEYPSVMEFSLTKRPMLVASVILNEVTERPAELPVFLASLLVEFGVVLLALRDVAMRVGHSPWDIVQSTKQGAA